MRFRDPHGCRWNISLFHYCNHGADYGRVLCAFELPDEGRGLSTTTCTRLATAGKR